VPLLIVDMLLVISASIHLLVVLMLCLLLMNILNRVVPKQELYLLWNLGSNLCCMHVQSPLLSSN
jgi:hypothetical protein